MGPSTQLAGLTLLLSTRTACQIPKDVSGWLAGSLLDTGDYGAKQSSEVADAVFSPWR